MKQIERLRSLTVSRNNPPNWADITDLLSHIDALEARVAEAESKTSGVLEVKLIDQNGVEVGSKGRFYRDLLKEEAWRDEGGTIWTQPTAWAYAAVCQARDKHHERAEAAERALADAVKQISHLVRSVDDLISESEGVYGLHLNGDPAPWYSLTEGGHFEDWLIELERARAFIAKMGEK